MTELRVVHMPGRMGGEATIGDSRIDCRAIAGMVWAGDTVDGLAQAYGLEPDEVRLACWWLVEHAVPRDDWESQAWVYWYPWAKYWGALPLGEGARTGDPIPEPTAPTTSSMAETWARMRRRSWSGRAKP